MTLTCCDRTERAWLSTDTALDSVSSFAIRAAVSTERAWLVTLTAWLRTLTCCESTLIRCPW